MKNSYTIEELYGEAWNDAIQYVGEALGLSPLDCIRKWPDIEDVAIKLGVKFNENGEIIRR